MLSPDDARRRLLQILDNAKTFEELDRAVLAEYAAKTGAIFGSVVKLFAESDPSDLDGLLQERLAQVLSRFVESTEALRLAGILESGEPEPRGGVAVR